MTEKRNAQAVEVAKTDFKDGKPGEFVYTFLHGRPRKGGPYGMMFCCPCGCGEWGSLAFDNRPKEFLTDDKWHWDGNREKPTLTPSIQKNTGCRWHGFLTDGEFREKVDG